MAVDEALLGSAGESGVPALRFYQWSEPTLSLGYFQLAEERHSHQPSARCALVRRATGGGAILHDQELTYSLSLPQRLTVAKDARSLYAIVHGALISILSSHGIEAVLCERQWQPDPATERFLCFERRAATDVLVGGYKICGSAQRRHKSAVLQHGSILLARSKCAPELPGLRDLAETLPPTEDIARQLWTRLAGLLGFNWVMNELSADEIVHAQAVQQSRFADIAWTLRR